MQKKIVDPNDLLRMNDVMIIFCNRSTNCHGSFPFSHHDDDHQADTMVEDPVGGAFAGNNNNKNTEAQTWARRHVRPLVWRRRRGSLESTPPPTAGIGAPVVVVIVAPNDRH